MERAPRVAREPGARAAARLHRRRARLAFFALTRDELFAGISVVSLLLGIGYLPFQLGRGFIAAIALARERYEAYAAIELVRTAVLIAVAVLLTFLIGVDGALIGIAASGVVSYVAAAVWAVRYARVAQEKAQAGGGRLREAMTFGSKAWGATLLQLINYRLDLFLLAAYVARADVGRYSVALSVTALAWVLPAALETVIFPRTADLHAAHDRGEIAATESDAATARAVAALGAAARAGDDHRPRARRGGRAAALRTRVHRGGVVRAHPHPRRRRALARQVAQRGRHRSRAAPLRAPDDADHRAVDGRALPAPDPAARGLRRRARRRRSRT